MTPDGRAGEFVSAFLDEADELLRAANANLLAMEPLLREGRSLRRQVREAFRSVHTIKGLAGMVGFEPIVTVSHHMETILRTADRSGSIEPAALEALLQGTRTLDRQLRDVSEGRPPRPPEAALVDQLESFEAREVAAEASTIALELPPELLERLSPGEREHLAQGLTDGKRVVRVDFVPSHGRADAGLTITTVRERIGTVGDIVKVLPRAVAVSDEAPGGLRFTLLVLTDSSPEALAAAAGLAPEDAAEYSSGRTDEAPAAVEPEDRTEHDQLQRAVVRVDVSRLDDAMERLSALIVTRFRFSSAVARLAERGVDVRELNQILAENARQLRDARAAILRVRMVRVSELLERVPLVVRSVRRATGKQVRLHMDAGGAEVDKAVGERLFPALVHLVRNAVDHAIETPGERRAAGKGEEGTLTITCLERTNTQLELSVSDDGRGISADEIAARAGAAVPANDAALLALLCTPGLSTREQATETSGRGMGMDIVKRIVEELGGELLMRTRPAFGTTFTMRVPLTISIVDAFSLLAAGHRFVVPVSAVEEIVQVDPERVFEGPATLDGRRVRVLERRGEAVPLFDLAASFRLSGPGDLRAKALVVRRAGERFAFGVDRMLGQQEVVVRPLDDRLVRAVGVTGATDLGDGRPTLVLDLASLVAAASAESGGTWAIT